LRGSDKAAQWCGSVHRDRVRYTLVALGRVKQVGSVFVVVGEPDDDAVSETLAALVKRAADRLREADRARLVAFAECHHR
jgi:hypothetical protein